MFPLTCLFLLSDLPVGNDQLLTILKKLIKYIQIKVLFNDPFVFLAGSLKPCTLQFISDSPVPLFLQWTTHSIAPSYPSIIMNDTLHSLVRIYVFQYQIIVEYLHLDNSSVNWPKSALWFRYIVSLQQNKSLLNP